MYTIKENLIIGKTLTAEVLRELVIYDYETGIFTWKHRDRKWFKTKRSYGTWNTLFSGKVAGNPVKVIGNSFYADLRIFGKTYRAHRLAFLYVTGEFPEKHVDHIDGNGLNNKWNNLRDVSVKENAMNRSVPLNNSSGVMGVNFFKRVGKWTSNITVDTKRLHLGYFDNKEDAIKARKEAETQYDYHVNHGREKINYDI